METSSILSTIRAIKKKVWTGPQKYKKSFLHNYELSFDEYRQISYISAEVCLDSLDNGSDPTDLARQCVKIYGARSGDHPGQFIGQKLGGCGDPCNVFPLNASLDTSAWKTNEDRVYEHVKKGDNRYAKLIYAMEINEENEREIQRIAKIYYYFELIENDKSISQKIEGIFENTSPRLTNKTIYL